MTSPQHVLVAEDDPSMRDIVVETLRKRGYLVTAVADGELLGRAALEPWAPFDLLVSDIRLPLRSGLSVLEALRATGQTLPAILMTGFGDHETRERVESLGGVLLEKPFPVQALCAKARELLGHGECSARRP
jgi:DNA-binding response OmpR family regulator